MSTQLHSRAAVLRVAALTVGGAALIAACSSTTTSSGTASPTATTAAPATTAPTTGATSTPAVSPTGTPTSVSAATCQHVNSLRNSVESLTHVSLSASSASTISADLQNIQTQLTALQTQGNGAFSTQIKDLTALLDQVKRATNGLTTAPTAAQVQKVLRSLAGLKGRAAGLMADMTAACPKK